ncbi:ferrous iron transport protein A [Desulfococcaceae bacterium OttesenSCG-928-F15]|nr:ferrous iron transport protein A [Desulfococcaceae bacterium OttesenSCG-928-F15]
MATQEHKSMQLSDLEKNRRAVIRQCTASGLLKQKLISMGFVPGVEVLMVRNAPLLDPIEISLQNYLVTLRKTEASHIEVEAI